MTRDDIIHMALKAGFSLRESFVRTELRHEKDGYVAQFCLEPLERFAALVAAAERDACAVICDELESFWAAEKDAALLNGDMALSNATSGEPRAARAIAQAIRARGES